MNSKNVSHRIKERPFYHLKQATHYAFLIIKKALDNHPEINRKCPKLTPVQSMVLRHLVVEDGISQAKLAELSGKDNPGMTRILDNMEKQEIVVRKRSAEDRRVSNVFLTPRAEKMILAMEPVFEELVDVAFRDFSLEEMKTFGSMCRRIRENCQKEIEKYISK